MNESSFNTLIVLFSMGLALMLVVGANYFLTTRSSRLRLPILFACFGSAALLPLLFAPGYFAVAAVVGAIIGFLALLGLGSKRVGSAIQAVSRFVRRPVGQGVVLGTFGLLSIAG